MNDVELIEVIRTTLKTEGDGEDTAIHTHEQFWTKDGELLAENCVGGFCEFHMDAPMQDEFTVADAGVDEGL